MVGTENVGETNDTVPIQVLSAVKTEVEVKKNSTEEEHLEKTKRIIKMTFFLKISLRPDFFKIVDVATPEEKHELSNLHDVSFKTIESNNDSEKYVVRAALVQRRLEEKKETTCAFDPGIFKFTATLLVVHLPPKKKTGKKKWDWKKRGAGKKMATGKPVSHLLCFKEVGTEAEIRAIAPVAKMNCGTASEYQVCKADLRGKFLRSLEHSRFISITPDA